MSGEIDWGPGSPPPPDQWWSEILTTAQLRLVIAINDHDAAYLANKRRQITCDRLRAFGMVVLREGRLRLTDRGREALTEFAEEGEYEIDEDGFVVWGVPPDYSTLPNTQEGRG